MAFEAAGAEVLFAPEVPDVESLRLICEAVSKPVSMIGSMAGSAVTVAQLKVAGVKRLSTAGSWYAVGASGLRAAALSIRDHGRFEYAS